MSNASKNPTGLTVILSGIATVLFVLATARGMVDGNVVHAAVNGFGTGSMLALTFMHAKRWGKNRGGVPPIETA